MHNMPDRAWVEINLDSIANNLMQIKRYLGNEIKINGVIKADGYGHGAIMTAGILCEKGIDMLSVATLDEAVQLRKKKVKVPVLVLGYTGVGRIEEIIKNNIIVTIFDYELAEKLSDEAVSKGSRIRAHIKIDTGMNRIGFHYTDEETILKAYDLKGIDIEGAFTHFSTADEKDAVHTNLQYKRFTAILEKLRTNGINPGICHTNNSGGALLHPDKSLDMVRTGLLIYGLYPSDHTKKIDGPNLEAAMTFKARIIKVKDIEAGEPISYGNSFTTTKKTRIATISCGYADGYSRVLSGKAKVIINGEEAPVVGNICMDMCMADITGIEGTIKTGDEVIMFNNRITVDDIAAMMGTINYEIICRIGMRVPKVYIRNGKIMKVTNYLL
ncbi:MAG: alanine racemase [Clostridia bacterium]|nr:alanine racemase [Clostridia bacterium]MBN2882142.1 alanine racemase [Clostridia bacterium]